MRNLGLCILLSVAVLTVYACSTANQGSVPIPTEDNRETFSVEVVGGMGSFTPEMVVEETTGGVAVTVKATEAEELAGANFNLHYDSKLFSPEKVELTDFLGIHEQVLSLTILDGKDHVAVGVAQIHNRGGIPVNGSGDLATVFFNNGPATTMRHASAAPGGDDNAVSDLLITGQSADAISLRWTEVNLGDYDNNSEVNMADLTPIAILFGRSDFTPHVKLVDGDRNGEVNLADISVIAKNYQNTINGYTIYTDGAGTENIGEGRTVLRENFPVFPDMPVVYTYTGSYDPLVPAMFTVRPAHEQGPVLSTGEVSNIAEAVIEEGPPETPTNIGASSGEGVGSGNIYVAWTKSTFTNQYDVAAYEIQRSVSGAGSWVPLPEVEGAFDSHLDTGLVDQAYDYQVRARDYTDLTSDWSAIATATPWFLPPPPPPVNVTAVPSLSEGAAVRVEWDAPVGVTVTSYIIYGQEQGGAGFVEVGSTDFGSTEYFTHTGLAQATTYEYQVSLVNDSFTESAPSEIVSSMCSEEGDIAIISLTTDKRVHYNDGGDADAATITVVSDTPADSVEWGVSPVGSVTGTGSSVTYKPAPGTDPQVITITCTVHKGSGEDSRTIKMHLTDETIKTGLGDGGRYIEFTGIACNVVPDAPYRPFSYYMDGETTVLINKWGIW